MAFRGQFAGHILIHLNGATHQRTRIKCLCCDTHDYESELTARTYEVTEVTFYKHAEDSPHFIGTK
jgi:hypothetical protein